MTIDRTVSDVEWRNRLREDAAQHRATYGVDPSGYEPPTVATQADEERASKHRALYGVEPSGFPQWLRTRWEAPAPGPAKPSPPPVAAQSEPRANCLDCGDLLPRHRHLPRCTRCNAIRIKAAQDARDARAHEQAQQSPPVRVFNCLACRVRLDAPPKRGPLLCSTCHEERYVEQPDEEDGVLVRESGALPHLSFYINRRGESVHNGRVLAHTRYEGESSWDRLGTSAELVDIA